ncbi:MAG: hypothetical protein GTO29_08655 [Candidatus Latescibacteria bacterium]|nr:hypothetical protein [Candidatus Latescibacterota bacterium]NIO56233.1 hypothetical protein [Candidatus Latescibacterota bacterium]
MNSNELRSLMKWLTVHLIVMASLVAVLFILSNFDLSDAIGGVYMLGYIVALFAFWAFIVCLGRLAKRLNRSWIVWCALTWFTTPIGPWVAYFHMRSLVNNALKEP